MSFDELSVKVGRKPITVVELDLDICEHVYGSSPCAAAIGLTGTQKCYNTFKTCQDATNYSKVAKIYRFCSDTSFLPVGENIFPCIRDIDIAPTQLNPKGFSVSASVTVTLNDFPHHDRGVDPYVGERTYDPTAQGSFFGKLRARNPYLINRVMRVKTGYVGSDRTIYTQSRTYFIERMEGPDANGRVKIVGKDVLRFAEAEKATAPVASKGLLASAIDNDDTSLDLTPTGIGADYPSSGTVRIGDELITYSGKSGDQLTGLTRGTDGTTAESHDQDETVQLCIRYEDETIPAILADLLENYANIGAGYLPVSDWELEATTWLGSLTTSAILSEPKGVKDLVEEILEGTGCTAWWDEIDAEIKFKVVVPFVPTNDTPRLNELENVLAGSLSVKDLEKERVSRVIVYYNLINGVANPERREGYRSIDITVDANGESASAYGTTQQREIFSRWLPSTAFANELGTRLLSRYKETPREIKFRLDAKDASLRTGDLFDIDTRHIQKNDGSNSFIRFIVTEYQEVEEGTHYEYTGLQVSATGGGRAALIAPDDVPDWTDASDEQRQAYMFISNDAGFMSDLEIAPRIT